MMAKKKRSAEEESKLHALADRMLLTIRFIEDVQDFPSGVELRRIVEAAATKGDLRALRLISREVEAMTTSLAAHERDGLETLLQHRLGVDKDAERAELSRQVAQVIRRGTIASEKERRRLEDYAEMLDATGGDPAEIAAVRTLLRDG